MTNICVFTGSSEPEDVLYHEVVQDLGMLLGRNNHTLVYGGTNFGLMGLLSRTTKRHGGRVIAIAPKMFAQYAQEQDELIVTDDLRSRKARMNDVSEAFIATPGGFGTLDEIVDVLVHKQLGFHKKPLVIINANGFYDGLLALFEKICAANFARPDHMMHYHIVESPQQALDYIYTYTPPEVSEKKG